MTRSTTSNNAVEVKKSSSTSILNKIKRPEVIINNILVIALVIMMVYFTSQTPTFLTVSNFEVILTNNAVIGVLVAAMALLVIAGHVDLSVGSNIGFAGTLVALANTEWGLSPWLSMLVGIGGGALGGTINGVLCGVLRFNPVIVTLGMLGILRGATLLIQQNEISGLDEFFVVMGNGDFLHIPIQLWIVAISFVAAAIFISLTTWGRYVYAIGSNPRAAFLAALPVRALPFALYVVTGAAAGLAGVMSAARLDGSAPGALGLQMELQALTIVLLGGVAFAGGRGRIGGVATAWIFLGVLENGLTQLNVTPFVQLVAAGLALVFAASLDSLGSVLGPLLEGRRRVGEQRAAAGIGTDAVKQDDTGTVRHL
ncbi:MULTISPECIES: ABC transporter permease [Aminobacter]|jgi:ribose/xylose/arabinose/galactoside ABC-type transport system permease subunit|uniref:Ribose/xylose/arabinose/galactoside ABC-type transport system permease subunit n=1 Tax=Aminobacter ciceronei TaxID=150723 RepID=A0ABR6CH44_9HYPH|nr:MULTISPECIES: ABC transporter permease [Aminobacter]MBA8910560.1 ribose/xylose/arabinose/galactoside ABC-type transport system permease subunit [Aminobacter ciceronei]MBA9024332.1 ribose/xylose/arabinose/galactoside ABC-type transport system permease subunit [Aminobacter ciceronei]MCX8571043.1 ABC transporter permease [Aminobacter sp. MET-1]QOF70816.1 ABC transporter permease [Aminobacter sp. SR38]